MPERELDDIARKMPSDRDSSTEPGGGTRTADEDEDDYSEEAEEAVSELTSPDESDRLEASYSLDLEDEGLLDEVERGLRERLEYDDPDVRAAAARSLGEIGSEDSVDALREASKDKVRAVSNAATEALRQVVNSDGRRRLEDGEEVGEPSSETADGHAEPDTSTEESVKGTVHGEDGGVASRSGPDDREASGPDEAPVEDREDAAEGDAAAAEGELGIPDAVVLRLGESGNEGVEGLVESSLRSAVESYPGLAEEELERYVGMLSDDREVVRRYGSRFLSTVSAVDASIVEDEVDAVVDALDDADDVVQEYAEEALENLARESPETLTEIVVEAKKND